jgi:hypothetical protein
LTVAKKTESTGRTRLIVPPSILARADEVIE